MNVLRYKAQSRPNGPREGTVLIGTLFTPRFAPTALSSEGTDCPPEDFQKMVNLSLMVEVDKKGHLDNLNKPLPQNLVEK